MSWLLAFIARWRAARSADPFEARSRRSQQGALCHRMTDGAQLGGFQDRPPCQAIGTMAASRCPTSIRRLRWCKPCATTASTARSSAKNGKPSFNRERFNPALAGLRAGVRNWTSMFSPDFLFLLLGSASSMSQVACKPLLSIKSVREVRSPSPQPLPWRWNATIVADTGFCATRSGNFEVDFVRIKEYSPDIQFTAEVSVEPKPI